MTRRGSNFDFIMEYDGERIRVTGFMTDYTPATMYDRNGDVGSPAEGGEIEDYKVFKMDGTEIPDDDGKIIDALDEDIFERVSQYDGPDED